MSLNMKKNNEILKLSKKNDNLGVSLMKQYDKVYREKFMNKQLLEERYKTITDPLKVLVKKSEQFNPFLYFPAPLDVTSTLIGSTPAKKEETGSFTKKKNITGDDGDIDEILSDENKMKKRMKKKMKKPIEESSTYHTCITTTDSDDSKTNTDDTVKEETDYDSDEETYMYSSENDIEDEDNEIGVEIALGTLGLEASRYTDMYKTSLSRKRGPIIIDKTFGIRIKNRKTYLGNTHIYMQYNILHCGTVHILNPTEGLWELLFLAKPKNYSKNDLINYSKMIKYTNAHKVNNEATGRIKSNAGYKYLRIIKPLFSNIPIPTKSKKTYYHKGGNISALKYKKRNLSAKKKVYKDSYKTISKKKVYKGGLHKTVTNNPVEYVYWDNLDELLERIYILYGELKAGNTNPNITNEIINIVQEFKEIPK